MAKSRNNSNHGINDVEVSLHEERRSIERVARSILDSLRNEFPDATDEELIEIALKQFGNNNR